MAKTIEFYWDLGSTNSYFALHLIKPVAANGTVRGSCRTHSISATSSASTPTC